MRTVMLIVGTFMVFYGIIIVKQREEHQAKMKGLLKEIERLDRETDSLLIVRDSLMKKHEINVNYLNSLKQ